MVQIFVECLFPRQTSEMKRDLSLIFQNIPCAYSTAFHTWITGRTGFLAGHLHFHYVHWSATDMQNCFLSVLQYKATEASETSFCPAHLETADSTLCSHSWVISSVFFLSTTSEYGVMRLSSASQHHDNYPSVTLKIIIIHEDK